MTLAFIIWLILYAIGSIEVYLGLNQSDEVKEAINIVPSHYQWIIYAFVLLVSPIFFPLLGAKVAFELITA